MSTPVFPTLDPDTRHLLDTIFDRTNHSPASLALGILGFYAANSYSQGDFDEFVVPDGESGNLRFTVSLDLD